jgi:hypothetical protein
MKRKFLTILFVTSAIVVLALYVNPVIGQGRKDAGVVYVTGQGLFYETFGTTDLPPKGPFQELIPPEVSASGFPETEYGPGDPGYLGGRWWVDANGNGQQDEGDAYFQCPLLGPGTPVP